MGDTWQMEFTEDGDVGPGYDRGDDQGRDADTERLRLSDLRKLARRSRGLVVRAARAGDRPTFVRLLRTHLGDLADLEVVEETWPAYDQVNVQVALDAWLAEPGRSHQLVGMTQFQHTDLALSDLLRPEEARGYGPRPGNVSWTNLPCGPGGQLRQAVRAGVYLVRDDDVRAAVLVVAGDPEMGRSGLQVQLVADRPGAANEIAGTLRTLAVQHNVFRGQVISFGSDMFGERETALRFHERPRVDAEDVVLPEATLAMIRRQVIGVAEHREQLLAARQHLKRGLLLYGPPGVGKTHTLRHLVGQLGGVTVVELTGEALGLIGTACSVARTLQPSMVVVEDVDLIAEDRGMHPGNHPLLFQLLEEMDGLAEDADVVFLLTTNRADVLEPALAARPGRIDQAVAMELPDADARRRLFQLYRGALEVDESRLDTVLERTEGVTASFLKELLRRSALIASAAGAPGGNGGPLHVSADQLDEALAELLDTRNAMTRVLLGGRRDDSREDED